MTMITEQLEELLGNVTQGEWEVEYGDGYCGEITDKYDFWNGATHRITSSGVNIGEIDREHDATLVALAPSLARRVIAAEKLVEALMTTRSLVTEASGVGFNCYDGD